MAAKRILSRVSEAYGRMLLLDGLFQADGHPGNILVMKGGKVGRGPSGVRRGRGSARVECLLMSGLPENWRTRVPALQIGLIDYGQVTRLVKLSVAARQPAAGASACSAASTCLPRCTQCCCSPARRPLKEETLPAQPSPVHLHLLVGFLVNISSSSPFCPSAEQAPARCLPRRLCAAGAGHEQGRRGRRCPLAGQLGRCDGAGGGAAAGAPGLQHV